MGKSKLAVITGGSSGIGQAIVERLLQENYQVINADIQNIEYQGNYKYLDCDITKAGDVNKLGRLISETGNPSVLILNAGRGIQERLREGDPEKWCEIINLNVCGTLRVLRAVLPFMNKGHVIFISSVSSTKPHPYGGIYSSTKSAIDTIAETLRLEELPDIKVAVISPGVVETSFFRNMAAGESSIESIGQGAVKADEVAGVVSFIINQKEETAINNIVMRPSGQEF